jgi:hypothetical protein
MTATQTTIQCMYCYGRTAQVVLEALVDTDVLIGLLNAPPWPNRAAAA